MKSPVAKRSIVVHGHKTSVSLEDAFWNKLKEIGGERHMPLSDLVAAIDSQRSLQPCISQLAEQSMNSLVVEAQESLV